MEVCINGTSKLYMTITSLESNQQLFLEIFNLIPEATKEPALNGLALS